MTSGDGVLGSSKDLKYILLADALRGDVATGAWPLGGCLPAERELAVQHGVAVNTVRRAISILCGEGLLERRQGSGTFVLSRPSRQASKPHLVGVLVPSTTYYYPRVLAGIERALSGQDVRMMLSCAHYDPDEELRQAARLVSAGAQGLLLVPTFHVLDDPAGHLTALRSLDVPQVLVERTPPVMPLDDDTEYVATDHVAGAYTAVRHLARHGHERIAYLGRSGTASAGPVNSGFDAALADGVACDEDQVVRREAEAWSTKALGAFVEECRLARVTGVVCLGDREATGLVGAAHRAGLRVPEDLAVVAYDDEVAELAEVPLTAIRPPKEELGRLGAQLLLRRLRLGPAAARHQVRIKPAVVVRESCGASPVEPAAPSLAG